MAILKFGQYVKLTVQNQSGGVVFESDTLRIDFDIRNIPGFSRAKFEIYNLNTQTINDLVHGENYVTVQVATHDGLVHTLADHMYVSNALEVPEVPHSITKLYCFPGIRKKFLEKQVDTVVTNPTLRRSVQQMADEIGYGGVINYVHFPSQVPDHEPPSPWATYQGSFLDVLKGLGEDYGFKVYTNGDNLDLMCLPNSRNVSATKLFSSPGQIQLTTSDMVNNPKIGPATLSIDSILNPDIKPASILDISNLLFAESEQTDEQLQANKRFLIDKVAGAAKYQTLGVQHLGSNWSKLWSTKATATSPQPGLSMPVADGAWFK